MRLHRPVHPRHQPHHAHSFAKTDTYASSGQDGAAAGDRHASSGAGFHQGGIPADGRYSPNSIAVAGAGFDTGGEVGQDAFYATAADNTPTNDSPPRNNRNDRSNQDPTASDLSPPKSDMDSPLAPSQQSARARPNRSASTSQSGPSAGGSALGSSRADDRDPAWDANNAFKARIARDSYPSGHGFDDGGLVPDNGLNPLNNILNQTKGPTSKISKQPAQRPPDYGPTQEQGGPQRSSDASDSGGGDGGAEGYDSGGIVDPKAYVQWPEHLAGTPGGFAEGGEVNPDAFLGRADLSELANHAGQVYNDYHAAKERDWNAQLNPAQQPTDQANQPMGQSDAAQPAEQSFAQGGGIPAPPGPAGPGVKPQSPTGNAGRPNWTAPNPTETASEKNYAQNVTSRPATSPARGTAFPQAGPDGGQRGQEWYGKGASPYGAGRKKKNG